MRSRLQSSGKLTSFHFHTLQISFIFNFFVFSPNRTDSSDVTWGSLSDFTINRLSIFPSIQLNYNVLQYRDNTLSTRESLILFQCLDLGVLSFKSRPGPSDSGEWLRFFFSPLKDLRRQEMTLSHTAISVWRLDRWKRRAEDTGSGVFCILSQWLSAKWENRLQKRWRH